MIRKFARVPKQLPDQRPSPVFAAFPRIPRAARTAASGKLCRPGGQKIQQNRARAMARSLRPKSSATHARSANLVSLNGIMSSALVRAADEHGGAARHLQQHRQPQHARAMRAASSTSRRCPWRRSSAASTSPPSSASSTSISAARRSRRPARPRTLRHAGLDVRPAERHPGRARRRHRADDAAHQRLHRARPGRARADDSATQLGALNAFQSLATQISSLAGQIQGLRHQVDQQIASAATQANTLIKQIYDLNTQAQQDTTVAASTDSATLLDQRDLAVASLAAAHRHPHPDPARRQHQRHHRPTASIWSARPMRQLSYSRRRHRTAPMARSRSPDINPQHRASRSATRRRWIRIVGSGQLKGLIDMRDRTWPASAAARQSRAQHRRSPSTPSTTPTPPIRRPTSLTGRDTGLLSTDALNFTGKTTIAVTDSSGNLVSRIDVDFDAGTLSVDGGAPASFGTTVGSFTTALNTALGGNGTASFTNGAAFDLRHRRQRHRGAGRCHHARQPRRHRLLAILRPERSLPHQPRPRSCRPACRRAMPAGLPPAAQITLSLKGPDGDIVKQASVTITAGMTIGNVITALNTAMGGAATFTLNSDGSTHRDSSRSIRLSAQRHQRHHPARHDRHELHPAVRPRRPTDRRTSGVGLLGQPRDRRRRRRRLAFAQVAASLPPRVAGDTIVGHGDNSGALALQNVSTTDAELRGRGRHRARSGVARRLCRVLLPGRRAPHRTTATSNQTTQDDRLQEAQSRQPPIPASIWTRN